MQRPAQLTARHIFLLDMPADECGIGDTFAVVIDTGELPLGGLAESRAIGAEGKVGHLEERFGLHDERARIWKPKGRSEREERDHPRNSMLRYAVADGYFNSAAQPACRRCVVDR
jgi:hypothetical protein